MLGIPSLPKQPHAVACRGTGCPLIVQQDRNLPSKGDFGLQDPVRIEPDRAVNTEELSRVQFSLKIGDRFVDAMLSAVHHGIRQFALSNEMSDRPRIQK